MNGSQGALASGGPDIRARGGVIDSGQQDFAAGQPAVDPPRIAGSTLAELSNTMVRLYKEQFGRGPTKARSHFVDENTVLCVLDDTFTQAERNLVALGEQQRLRDVRVFFQHATEEEFRGAVERITGRRVVSFISGIDANTDTAIEFFILEPAGGEPGDVSLDEPGSVES